MVKVSAELPRNDDGRINLPLWADQLCDTHDHLQSAQIEAAGSALAAGHPDLLPIGVELAEMVADLNMDQAAVMAAMIYRAAREQRIGHAELVELVGDDAANIANQVAAMATASLLEMSNSPLIEKEQGDQVENVKRLLVSMIQDPRVAVLKLAERVLALRRAKSYEPARRMRIAQEASGIFAPLAGRLGIWQLKWELEDLALRYTEEEAYQSIARHLRGKRTEREVQMEHIIDQVRGLLRGHGIDAVVYGRAKHIYSIWRKMQSKGVTFDQVYDVRAVRVVVGTLAECYAALGVLHAAWQHIPSEFDDYIANPKENGYQSIHTAVTAADGRTLEVQIRTVAMHEDAELGVCAHWSYKDGAAEDGSFAAKMDWLRQVMEWHDDLGGTQSLRALLAHRVSEDRIYISTPKGHVIDLPRGATGLDFAYRVHTDIGHSARHVRVNGVEAPLNRVLENGQQVEIVTRDGAEPQRDWLEPELGFVMTDRARAKLYSHFRNLALPLQIEIGRRALLDKLAALGWSETSDTELQGLASELGKQDSDAMWRAVGAGECSAVAAVLKFLAARPNHEQLNLPGIDDDEFPVSIRYRIEVENRDGMLRDITALIGDLQLPLTGTTARVSNPPQQAIITVDVTISGWLQCVKFISLLGLIEGVIEVRRNTV